MPKSEPAFEYIDTQERLDNMVELLRSESWISFDTEFIGEKRFHVQLCLIQVGSARGIFIIDPIEVDDLRPFLSLITNGQIRKITHAGENDYRILYQHYNVVPSNAVDIQVAAGFAGYRYPVSYRKLGESELNIRLDKGFTVADWDSRPLSKKALGYAARDVAYLQKIWSRLETKLKKSNRMDWLLDECRFLENPQSYESNPDKEFLESSMVPGLTEKEKLFLFRLYRWRRSEAERLDYSKEMVLQNRIIGQIVKTVSGGLDAFRSHRRISNNIIGQHGDLFVDLYQRPAEPHEQEILRQIPHETGELPKQDLLTEMLDLIVKYKCLEENISHDIVLPRSVLKKLKADTDYFPEILEHGWRAEFLGKELVQWFQNRSHLDLHLSEGKIVLKLAQHS